MKSFQGSPFRKGCNMEKIYTVLARSAKPLALPLIAKHSHVNFGTTQRMVAAMRNEYHNAPLRRIGISVVNGKDGFALARIKPQPEATRPARGKSKSKSKGKSKKSKTVRTKKPAPAAPGARATAVSDTAPVQAAPTKTI